MLEGGVDLFKKSSQMGNEDARLQIKYDYCKPFL
jgi:hypothetical protein